MESGAQDGGFGDGLSSRVAQFTPRGNETPVSFLRGSSKEGRGPNHLLENESMPDFSTNGNARPVEVRLTAGAVGQKHR